MCLLLVVILEKEEILPATVTVFFYKKPVKGHTTESFLILLWF